MTTPGTTKRSEWQDRIRQQVSDWHNRQPDYYPTTKEELTRYVLAADDAMDVTKPLITEVRRWLTDRCPECEVRVNRMTATEKGDHIIVNGRVVVGCEWFWVVNPAVLGISVPNWDDWTKYPGTTPVWTRP